VSNKSLTIVLPVHNGESRLRSDVARMLDLASELTSDFGILIVDDGSTDATYEVAEDMATRYPQIAVRRHRHRCGLGPAIEHVQRNVRSDAVIFHDGLTPMNVNQMRNVWRRWIAQNDVEQGAGNPAAQQQEICDFDNLPAIHAAMERAHGQLPGFQLIALSKQDRPGETTECADTVSSPRTDAAHVSRGEGVGRIPRLPRPKLLSAIADFAFGE
jgi:glycosyltransferase involved in cell wall biosynthesis